MPNAYAAGGSDKWPIAQLLYTLSTTRECILSSEFVRTSSSVEIRVSAELKN
jgi:hypothetical protein